METEMEVAEGEVESKKAKAEDGKPAPRLPRPPQPTLLPLLPPPLPLPRRGRSVRPIPPSSPEVPGSSLLPPLSSTTLPSSPPSLLPLATTVLDTDTDTDSGTPDTPATSDTDSTRWRSCFYLKLDCYV